MEIVNESGLETDVPSSSPRYPRAGVRVHARPAMRCVYGIVVQAFGLDARSLAAARVTGEDERSRCGPRLCGDAGAGILPHQTIAVYGANHTFRCGHSTISLSAANTARTSGWRTSARQTADFLLALQRVPGRNLALTHIRWPQARCSTSRFDALPADHRAMASRSVVETGQRETLVYASVIE